MQVNQVPVMLGRRSLICGRRRRNLSPLLRLLPTVIILLFVIQNDLSLNTFHSFVASAYGADALVSRLQTAQCALQVTVGRIPGTAMPEDWAASGAKLGFELEVEFCNEPCNYELTKERLLLGSAASTKQGASRSGKSIKAVELLNEPTFVSSKGQETILVKDGAYGCDLMNFPSQQYGLRFCLDFPEGAKRNDVELPPERIFFMTSCWIADHVALDKAKKRHRELVELRQNLQDEINTAGAGGGILNKVFGLRQMTLLVEKKNSVEQQLVELERTYPLQVADMIQPPQELLEGPKGLFFVKNGVIAVKRHRGAMGTREQYHWVGTFSISEFFDDL